MRRLFFVACLGIFSCATSTRTAREGGQEQLCALYTPPASCSEKDEAVAELRALRSSHAAVRAIRYRCALEADYAKSSALCALSDDAWFAQLRVDRLLLVRQALTARVLAERCLSDMRACIEERKTGESVRIFESELRDRAADVSELCALYSETPDSSPIPECVPGAGAPASP